MTKEQLKALIEFISAKASEVACNEVGLSGFGDAWSYAWTAEIELYKSFGFDRLEEEKRR